MLSPKVIGHNAEKLGISRSLVGSPETNIRGRMHTLLIGPPGVAKSMLTREAVELISNSRYVTAQNASGKGITAIIDKENDTTILRLGAVPQARGVVGRVEFPMAACSGFHASLSKRTLMTQVDQCCLQLHLEV